MQSWSSCFDVLLTCSHFCIATYVKYVLVHTLSSEGLWNVVEKGDHDPSHKGIGDVKHNQPSSIEKKRGKRTFIPQKSQRQRNQTLDFNHTIVLKSQPRHCYNNIVESTALIPMQTSDLLADYDVRLKLKPF
ncbi:hypothetical protein Pelo_18773 [Pelomyxa schiedti]|nr:hypothetical protein Pelo_18773 [Pelomyxa schiedti]